MGHVIKAKRVKAWDEDTTGYSVEVNDLYETEDAVFIHTTLLGPEAGEDIKEISTFPYVVVKLEYIDKNEKSW